MYICLKNNEDLEMLFKLMLWSSKHASYIMYACKLSMQKVNNATISLHY